MANSHEGAQKTHIKNVGRIKSFFPIVLTLQKNLSFCLICDLAICIYTSSFISARVVVLFVYFLKLKEHV